jgi:hypothetical protein
MSVITCHVGVNIAFDFLYEGKGFKLNIRVLKNDAMRSSVGRGVNSNSTSANDRGWTSC